MSTGIGSPRSGLARRTAGAVALAVFAVTASSPMAVYVGGVPATLATSGVTAIPAAFLALTAVLGLFAVGYVAMASYVEHAAPFYAFPALGLGAAPGIASGAVSLVAYNAIQTSLYGLFGATAAATLSGLSVPWWAWSLAAWAVVAVLGVRRITVNVGVLGCVLAVELVVIGLLIVAALANPAPEGGATVASWSPAELAVNGVGVVFALTVAAFVGFETAAVYSEESRGGPAVRRATLAALVFMGVLYAVAAWALVVHYGSGGVVDAARNPATEMPLSILGEFYGGPLELAGTVLLLTSVLASMLSFHNTIARYVYGMARDRVLPAAAARTGSGATAGAPIGGSLVQSVIGLVVILAFAGSDPFTVMFPVLSTLAAIGVLTLMAVTSVAVIRYFRRGGGPGTVSPLRWLVAPAVATAAIAVVLGTVLANLGSLLGPEAGRTLTAALPTVIVLAAVAGLVWALVLRTRRPEVYRRIGVGRPDPLEQLDESLARINV